MSSREDFEKLWDFEDSPYDLEWDDKIKCYRKVKTDEAFHRFVEGRESLLPVVREVIKNMKFCVKYFEYDKPKNTDGEWPDDAPKFVEKTEIIIANLQAALKESVE